MCEAHQVLSWSLFSPNVNLLGRRGSDVPSKVLFNVFFYQSPFHGFNETFTLKNSLLAAVVLVNAMILPVPFMFTRPGTFVHAATT
jgi:hypothetical protein